MRTLLAAALLLTACASAARTGNPADDVRLAADPASAAAGDSITLTLDNGSDVEIGYNLCANSLERQTAGGWELVPLDVACTMELRSLPADQQATYRTALPASLTSGQYRYVTSVNVMSTGAGHRVASRAFTVRS
jgi:hypothetical protein